MRFWPLRRAETRPRQQRPARLAPERRSRRDVIVAAVLAVLVVGGAVLLWRDSAVVGTTDRVAATPIAAPPQATGVPAEFVEAWRAESSSTPVPVVAGPSVVTADGGAVVGRDAVTGAEGWAYTRDRPLCTAGAAFPSSEGGRGRVLALYQGVTGYCSEMTALRPDTGARVAARNPNAMPGTRLLADDTFVVATGERYLEVVRSDLVRTLEYGAVLTPAQADDQPRSGCTYGSTVLADRRLGVIERCPGETTDRLTVLSPDPAESEEPEEEFSVLLPSSRATLVALSADRAAVALPDPPRLEILDDSGAEISTTPLDVPATDLAADPPGEAPATTAGADGHISWWTGTATIALGADLVPQWTRPDTLGPATPYGGGLLVPVPGGLVDVDATTGTPVRTIPVSRTDPGAPVRLAVAGDVLLEQRGPQVVALAPAP